MNKDQVKGVAEKVKGKVNETIGRATGDRKQEVQGDVQQAAGEPRKKAGDVKKAVKTRPESPSEAGLRRAPVSRRVCAKHLNGDA